MSDNDRLLHGSVHAPPHAEAGGPIRALAAQLLDEYRAALHDPTSPAGWRRRVPSADTEEESQGVRWTRAGPWGSFIEPAERTGPA